MMHNNEVESIATPSGVKEVNMAHYLGLFLLICNILFFVYSRYGWSNSSYVACFRRSNKYKYNQLKSIRAQN